MTFDLNLDAMIQAADLEVMLADLGIEVEPRRNKRGVELYFKCINPEHDDDGKKMSMAAQGQYKGLFYCWKCKLRGSIIHIIQHKLDLGFMQAQTWMNQKTGVGAMAGIESLKYQLKKAKLNYGVEQVEKRLPVYDLPATYQTIQSPNAFAEYARAYLHSRQISDQTQAKFHVGISEHKDLGWCITIPIIFRGQLHSIFFCQPKNGGLKRYPKDSPQGDILFNYDECLHHDSFVVVESILDVLMIDSMGYGPALACFTNMVSDTQVDLVKHITTKTVFPDRDSQYGWLLVNRLVERLDKSLNLVLPPLGKDPGDCTAAEIRTAFLHSESYADWEVANYMRETAAQPVKATQLKKP